MQRVAIAPPCACTCCVAPEAAAVPVRVAAVVGAQVGIRIFTQVCVSVGYLLRPCLADDPPARHRLTAAVVDARVEEVLIALPGQQWGRRRRALDTVHAVRSCS